MPQKQYYDAQKISESLKSETSEIDEEPGETKEFLSRGPVKSRNILWTYFRAGASTFGLFFLIFFFVFTQICGSGVDFLLGYWMRRIESSSQNAELILMNSTANSSQTNVTEEKIDLERTDYLSMNAAHWVYGVLVLIYTAVALMKNILFMQICKKASRTLHRDIFRKFLEAPMSFFDVNPAGIIMLGRFT